ncbi:MAG: hypothetical protein PHT54_00295 [Candidatus Nanoarchaeia archaeon]|nr:hypothetical protein [Candidatus Nanoarchaeia archaeon]
MSETYKIDKETLLNLEVGDVIRYNEEDIPMTTYLIVSRIDKEKGEISGQMATTIGVNAISIDDLLMKMNLEIAEWPEDK